MANTTLFQNQINESCFLYTVPAVLSSVWIVTAKMDYHSILSKSNCLLSFSFRDKAKVYVPVLPDAECCGLELETGVHMSFIMVEGVVPTMVKGLLDWS